MKLIFITSLILLSSLLLAQEHTEPQPTSNEINNSNNIEVEEERLEEVPVLEKKSLKTEKVTESAKSEGLRAKNKSAQELRVAYTQFNNFEKESNSLNYQRNPTKEQQEKMELEVLKMKIINEKSFLYNLSYYKLGNYNVDRIKNLKIAEKLQPNNKDVVVELAAYYTIKKNKPKQLDYLNRIAYSAELFAYAEDVIQSLPNKKVFLLTHGNKDTHPLLMKAEELRKSELVIINIDYLQSKLYRENLEEFGLVFPKNSTVDKSFIKSFCKLNASKSLYLAMSLPKSYLSDISNKLYVRGLTFTYSETKLETFYANKILWESEFSKKLFKKEYKTSLANTLKGNYLPLLIEIKKGLDIAGNESLALKYKVEIDKISTAINKSKQVQKALRK